MLLKSPIDKSTLTLPVGVWVGYVRLKEEVLSGGELVAESREKDGPLT